MVFINNSKFSKIWLPLPFSEVLVSLKLRKFGEFQTK